MTTSPMRRFVGNVIAAGLFKLQSGEIGPDRFELIALAFDRALAEVPGYARYISATRQVAIEISGGNLTEATRKSMVVLREAFQVQAAETDKTAREITEIVVARELKTESGDPSRVQFILDMLDESSFLPDRPYFHKVRDIVAKITVKMYSQQS